MNANGAVVASGQGRSFSTGNSEAQVKLESGVADFSVFESTSPVNPIGVPLHRHRSYDEAFFILEGEMNFVVGDHRSERLPPGTFVFAPRGVAHSFANPGPAAARMLVIGSPGVQALVEEVAPLVAARPPDLAAVNAAFARHDSEIVAPKG